MDKLEMAHEYAVAMLETPAQLTGMSDMDIAIAAFNLADAMQDEADKREVGIEELMKDHVHDYIYGRVCACGAINGAEKEWQPDWSQAPSRMNYFFMNRNGAKYWTVNKPDEPNMTEHVMDFRDCGGDCYAFASSQNYQGLWQDSLRKRPQ